MLSFVLWYSPSTPRDAGRESQPASASERERRAQLAEQGEDLLDAVWACERWWRVEDHIDAEIRRADVHRGARGG